MFDVDIDAVDESLYIVVLGEFRLADKTLLDMIESGDAYYALLIECPGTDYRCVNRCARKFKENIIKAEVIDRISVTPVILASRDINDFRHELLIDDYLGMPITVPEGGIIAFDDEVEIQLIRGLPQTVDSICKFRLAKGILTFNVDCDYIEIYLPEQIFVLYKKMTRQEKLVLTSIYFPPVLMQIIQEIFIDRVYAADELSEKRWYMAIDNAIRSFNINTENQTAYEISMDIIEGFLREGAETIALFDNRRDE